MTTIEKTTALMVSGILALGATACGGDDGETGGGGGASGTIAIDGSSTVFPFAQAAAEGFQQQSAGARVTVGESGTGGGFEKFCAGETDVSNASRPIKEEEIAACRKAGTRYAELQVANDGIAVVTTPGLEVDCLTTAQLKELWNTGSDVRTLRELDPELPDTELSLFGPGTDSGTFDFFTDEINDEEGATRKDYQPSEDDNVLVQGVSGDQGGLGYFGFSYYEQNQDRLNLVGVDDGGGCVKPSEATIQDGSYKPLARPLFMYVSDKALAEPQVKAFLDFVIANQATVAENAQIVPLTPSQLERSKQALSRLAPA